MRDGSGLSHAVHRGPTVVRTKGTGALWRAHRSLASGHSRARKLAGGGHNRERGTRGTRLRPHRGSGGDVAIGRQWGNNSGEKARASKEGEGEMGEVWCSTGARRPIYRAEGRSAEVGNSGNDRRQCLDLKVSVTRVFKRKGASFNGGMKEEVTRHLFLFSGGGLGRP
jgi:hypothetical protein